MKLRSIASLVLVPALLVLGAAAPRTAPAITEKELVRRTQEMFDALVPGNQAPWKRYFADDCLINDEKGRMMTKAQLLADLSPMPKGYSGTITVKDVHSRIVGNVAIMSYVTEETETIFGQEMHARYHQVDTWLFRHGEWQIAANQIFRYYEDPAIGPADASRFRAYAGTYELSKDSPRQTTISTEGGDLFMQRTGGAKVQLFPEAGDIFFRKGVEGRILFRSAGNGVVETLIDRRNNEDVVWRRL